VAPSSIAHLHNHTGFSLLDGMQQLSTMCEAAAADGQPAIAITDHGHPGGAWKFHKAAHSAGIKPIIGMEAYLAFGSRSEQNFELVPGDNDAVVTDADNDGGKNGPKEKKKNYQHLTLLVETPQGWSSLVAASNASHDSTWYKPRMDLALLAENAEGLIVLTGCLGGPVAGYLAQDRPDQAEANLRTLIEGHGAENVFVEVMDHGLPAERKVTGGLVELARKYNLRVVATNDAHYTFPAEAPAHECLLCIGQPPKKMSDEKRFKFRGEGYHLRTAVEMHALFDTQPGTELAVQNTLLIAERVHANVLPESRIRLPKFPCPDGLTSAQYLHQLSLEGAKERYGSPLPVEVRAQLRFEEDTIVNAGLTDYMLIVWDIVQATRAAGHRVGWGRGSAIGCTTSYSLGIVGLDPLKYNLLFERFVNPDRVGMPDIDIDLDSPGREFALNYTLQKYGVDMVAKIGTYGMARSKQAIKSVARVTSVPQTGDKLSRQVPSVAGKPLPLSRLLDPAEPLGAPFRTVLENDPFAPDVVETARVIEGVPTTEGVHACGVLIGDEPLDTFVPLRHEYADNKNRIRTGFRVTQWDGKDVDEAGLLKIDFLALRNLDVVTKAVELIEATTGEVIDTDNLPDPDDISNPRVQATYQLLAQGRTAGVFQMESAGITRLAEQIAPQNLGDIIAILALYRPGPLAMDMHIRYAARKAGEEAVDYGYLTSDPAEEAVIASVLGETYGAIVYQEQLMSLAVAVAGFTPGQSNKLLKAFSKKKREEMDEVGGWFRENGQQKMTRPDGTIKIAFSAATLERLWVTFDAAADYLFNKSHATGYGFLTFVTAFLNANWPAQYGAALLSVTDDVDKRLPLLNALISNGVSIQAPDVNLGEALTSVDRDGNVRIGMKEVKDAGAHAHAIVAERNAGGPFTSLADLINRVKIVDAEGKKSNISVSLVQALIEAGACDSFGPRMGLSAVLRAVRDVPDVAVPDVEWGVAERSRRERDRLGVIISEHPLRALGAQVKTWIEPRRGNRPIQIHRIAAGDGEYISTLGVVASYAERAYSKGKMASLVLEGSQGSIECVIWSRDLEMLRATDSLPHVGEIVGVTGRIQVRKFTVVLNSVEMDDSAEDADDSTVLTEEIERRTLTVQNLWRGLLDDQARSMAPLAQVIQLRPAAPPAQKSSRNRVDPGQQTLGEVFPPEVQSPSGPPATTAPPPPPAVVLPPQRREGAIEHVLIVKHGGRLLIDQMSLVLSTTELARVAPGLADREVLDKLGDWLMSAEPGARSDPLLCINGDVLYLEAGDVSPRPTRVRPLLERMRHPLAS
jgi:DNA polymerase-3 subunit alpha